MKLKIVHHNQETRALGQQPTTKEEKIEMEKKHQAKNNVGPHSHSSPCPTSDMIVSGARKRKPKELIDEVSTFVPTKRRNNKISNNKNNSKDLSDSKLRQGAPDTGGALASKGDDPAQMKTPIMIQAEELQASLGYERPTFLKTLVRSHVGSCFWMGLPVTFCKMNLPSTDTTVVVEDESGEEYPVKYIAQKTGLSAGWRRFVAGNKLIEGDVLVFQLIGPCRFKVYIVRYSQIKQNSAGRLWDQSSSICFKDIKSFEDFHIIVNGTCIDSELPDETRRDYYNLCCNRNSFLHDCIRPGLYNKLTAAMIVETVAITRALRGCKMTTPKKKFDIWERSLRSFELLGLSVAFLRLRLCRLVSLAYESEGALEMRKYLETQKGKRGTKEEILKLEMKLVELKEMSMKHDCGDMKNRALSFELEFQQAVDAPW